MLNFLIPVKNHAHINDWNNIKNNISSTLKSINNQSDNNWHCYIVCNFGCDLPELPDKNKFTVLFVDLHKKNIQQSDGLKAYYDAIREDKGLRLYTALKDVIMMTFLWLLIMMTTYIKTYPYMLINIKMRTVGLSTKVTIILVVIC